MTTAERANAARQRAARSPRPTRVLIADDDDELRRLIRDVLARRGYEVIEAADGAELASALGSRPWDSDASVDALITDVRMPGVTGITALEWLRETDWSTPVIVITGVVDRSVHEAARRLGAFVCEKPFCMEELLALLRRIVREPEERAAAGGEMGDEGC